jgi:hypothetical protein
MQGANQARIAAAKAVPIAQVVAMHPGLGLKLRGHEYVGPCPIANCGGDDRHSVDLRKNVFFCRVCKASGDQIEYEMRLTGCAFWDAIDAITGGYTGNTGNIIKPALITKPPPDPDYDAREKYKRAMTTWRQTSALAGTLAEVYLNSRKIFDIDGLQHVLRFHPNCPFGPDRHPCVVGLFRDIITNKPRAIHRTALTTDGKRLRGADGKKLKPLTLGSTGGAVVKLDPDEDVHAGLHLGEGIETTLAGRQGWHFRPAWAAGSAGGIASFPLLGGIESLTFLVDNDPEDERGQPGAGPRAATKCRQRWMDAGREVRAYTSSALGCDIADIVEFEAVGANNK